VNEAGDPAFCTKGQCGGSWKPPRAHHCQVCGVCRLGWDHHCPWLATCVTDAQLKPFIMLLLMATISVTFLAAPVIAPFRKHVSAALVASKSDGWALENWWNWWGSWIVAGGPVGRWAVGLFFGYQALQNINPPSDIARLGDFIAEPRFGFFVLMTIALAVAVASLALAVATVIRILAGESIVDTLKRKTIARMKSDDCATHQPLFWIPWRALDPDAAAPTPAQKSVGGTSNREQGMTSRASPTERPYDLGRSRNWNKVWWRPSSDVSNIPEPNNDMVRRMKVHMFLKKWSP